MRIASATSSRFVATRPPSPATSGFVGVRLNTSTSPKPPTGTPACKAPNACAASKITGTPWRRARSSTSFGEDGAPKTWVARIALVPSMRRDASSRSSWNDVGSHSANLGVAPFHATACADAEKVNDGISTSPRIASARTASMSPVVHEDTATTCGACTSSAVRRSSSATSGPFVSAPESHEPRRISVTRSRSGAGGRTNGTRIGTLTMPPPPTRNRPSTQARARARRLR
jgi:hypothetical protein